MTGTSLTGRFFAGALLATLAGCGAEPAQAPENLLLITIDTLRADRLGVYGGSGGLTPAIDAWAEDSVVFEEAHATSSWTLASLASLMTSTVTGEHGCWNFESALPDRATTLAELLRGEGFHTSGIPSHLFLAPNYGLHQGFVEYDTELVRGLQRSHEAISSRRVTTKGAAQLQALAKLEAPWFLWLHYFDPHEVYHAHPGFTSATPDSDEERRYDSEVAFTDAAIGRVLAELEQLGLADKTVVALTADHGEEWRDHGSLRHGHSLHRELVHVPLIVRLPGQQARRIKTPVSLIDLAPSLCTWLDVPGYAGFRGEDLTPLLAGDAPTLEERPLLEELRLRKNSPFDALRRGRWHLIVDRSDDSVLLFDLRTDPTEQRNLADENPELVQELLQELDVQRAHAATLGGNPDAAELAEGDLQRLIDLGYADESDRDDR